jgi:hypothetical protein
MHTLAAMRLFCVATLDDVQQIVAPLPDTEASLVWRTRVHPKKTRIPPRST